jgi:diadenosine tetraphosphate (Ap4A) HIT family hydrolase
MNNFELDNRLRTDTFPVMNLEISQLLLMNDARYPWLILVPKIRGLRDLHNLQADHYQAVSAEIARISRVLESITHAYKMNVGALGNQVSQLHIHIIARHSEDEAWPAPVWGVGTPRPYSKAEADAIIKRLVQALS